MSVATVCVSTAGPAPKSSGGREGGPAVLNPFANAAPPVRAPGVRRAGTATSTVSSTIPAFSLGVSWINAMLNGELLSALFLPAQGQHLKSLEEKFWQAPSCAYLAVNSCLHSDLSVETPCDSNPCTNGGSCMSSDNRSSYECICPVEWTGEACEFGKFQFSMWFSKNTGRFTLPNQKIKHQVPFLCFVCRESMSL